MIAPDINVPNSIKKDTLPLKVMKTAVNLKGFLFIGDPHIYSKTPGRRKDISFFETILDKIHQAAVIANENKLLPIFTGDLFHDDEEENNYITNRMMRSLREFETKPITIVGNHEKTEWLLSEKNLLSVLENSGCVEVISKNGFYGVFELVNENNEKYRVALGGTPYGLPIPYDLTEFVGLEGQTFRLDEDRKIYLEAVERSKKSKSRGSIALVTESAKMDSDETKHQEILKALECDEVVWLTHHDFAFENAYPKSIPLHPIDGVGLMVNGHIHDTKKPVKVGLTACYNPGNITRLSIDTDKHIPAVWEWCPFDNEYMASAQGVRVPLLKQIPLVVKDAKEIFNYEGRNAKVNILQDKDADKANSIFVEMLKQDQMTKKTDEGAFLRESIEEAYEKIKPKEEVKNIIDKLSYRVITERDIK